MQLRSFIPLVLFVSRIVSFHGYHPIPRLAVSKFQMRLKNTISIIDNNNGRRSKSRGLVPHYNPRSDNQKQYVSHLKNDSVPIVFGIGPAGCGKTLFACLTAIEGLKNGDFQKIILTRPIVPVEEEELGFLPGTLVKKMDPWTRPLMDIFLEFFTQQEIDFMISSSVIEISPLAYMRGRTFKRCFIIADEMQNSTPNQMLMLTTRIGNDSKMVITGDLKQSDRPSDKNGLLDVMTKIRDYRARNENEFGIEIVEMNHSDIERSPIVSKILDIYNPATRNVVQNVSFNNVTQKNSINKKITVIDINDDAALIPKSQISKRDIL
jgi:phosphate starvation-inducible PhoH-like protein